MFISTDAKLEIWGMKSLLLIFFFCFFFELEVELEGVPFKYYILPISPFLPMTLCSSVVNKNHLIENVLHSLRVPTLAGVESNTFKLLCFCQSNRNQNLAC
jgi:hypothetical protein